MSRHLSSGVFKPEDNLKEWLRFLVSSIEDQEPLVAGF
jgi:hypothetical protein